MQVCLLKHLMNFHLTKFILGMNILFHLISSAFHTIIKVFLLSTADETIIARHLPRASANELYEWTSCCQSQIGNTSQKVLLWGEPKSIDVRLTPVHETSLRLSFDGWPMGGDGTLSWLKWTLLWNYSTELFRTLFFVHFQFWMFTL